MMVARIRTQTGLAVTLVHGGAEVDREVAATGELAVLTGIAILLRRKVLEDGDRLDVTEAK
jgi:hypothetical protein